MPPTTRKRPRLGDIIEIAIPRGLAYAQATHIHPEFSYLLRVLPGIFEKRPEDFIDLVSSEPQFLLFFPLATACYRKIVQIVAEEPIPEIHRSFPTFRVAGARGTNGMVLNWLLWNGESEWRVEMPKAELAKFPIRSIWNDTLLIDRISSGWRASDDV